MADARRRVAAVIRHRGDVLACRDDAGRPVLPTRAVDDDEPSAAVRELLDDLGLADATILRRGGIVEVPEGSLVPLSVVADGRAVSPVDGCAAPSWVTPDEVRAADERWWRVYEAVAPTVETVRDDRERGSTALATDALWVLRDAAVEAADAGRDLASVVPVAKSLIEARPGMAALAVRVDRAMAGASTPEEVVEAATAGLERAADADAAAASLAAETIGDGRVLTLSRSGTVREALLDARPPVVVAASRPGGEGRSVAESLAAAGLTVETCTDADVYSRVPTGDVDAVLVGADAVTPMADVVNKVGTWAVSLAARWAEVPTYAVCASDKVRPAGEAGPEPPLEPMFDLTPEPFVTAVLTERGRLDSEAVNGVAEEHRELAAWRR